MTLEIAPLRVLRSAAVPESAVPPLADGTVALWLMRVTQDDDAYHLLDAEERRRWKGLVREDHRTRYLAAHGGLRRLLGRYLGIGEREVAFVREACPKCGGPHGRPAVRGGGIHFSLSHSQDLVFYGFASKPVGVDIEAHPQAGISDSVTENLHPLERDEFALLPPETRPAAFTRCWARKEAYLKGTGEGLTGGLARIYVGMGTEPAAVPGWSLTDVWASPGFAAAVAVSQQ
ncbi:4'-phosphopantetheinyl transferase family protein [Streptomyces sp. NPDC059104]|uniref:4'-phosphopantetheinyl transferase family protein n=1 Tax=Streptomyces sp. NPDC059104 TaxID=3346729 RepID=UPI0036C2A951